MSDSTITVSELAALTDLSTLLGAHRGAHRGNDLDVDQRIALGALDQERTLLARYDEFRQYLLDTQSAWDDLLCRYLTLKEFRRQLILNAVLTNNAMQYRSPNSYPLNDSIRIEEEYRRMIFPLAKGGYSHSAITRRAIEMVQSTDDEWTPLAEEYTKEAENRRALTEMLGPMEIALRQNRAVLEAACSRASGLLPDLEELTFPPRPEL